MGMRSAAALLLVTLIGPSIMSRLCDFTCVHHEHHSPQAASAQACHEQHSSNDGPVVAGVSTGFCHDETEVSATAVAEARLLKGAPVAVVLPAALAVYRQHLRVAPRSTSSGPPGFILLTTPLRI